MGPGELIRGSALVVLAIVGCSVVVLTGWSGQVSLGQMSFAAVGAVVGAVALLDWHWDLSLALLLAGAAAGRRRRRGRHPHPAPRRHVRRRHHAGLRAWPPRATSSSAAEFSWIPQGQLGVPYLFGLAITSQASVFELCLGRAGAGARRAARPAPQPDRARPARAAGQPAGRVGLRRPGHVGQADRLRRLGLHRRPGRLPPARGEPAVRGDLVPGAGQPRRVHLDRGGRAGVGLRRHPRRRHRRGQRHLPAAELAALPGRARRAPRPHPLPPRAGRPLLRPARLGARARWPGASRAAAPGVTGPVEPALAP